MKQESMLETFIEESIEGIMRTRHAHIEMFSAAFLEHVGSKEASKYSLVEQRSEDMRTTTWTFKLTEEIE